LIYLSSKRIETIIETIPFKFILLVMSRKRRADNDIAATIDDKSIQTPNDASKRRKHIDEKESMNDVETEKCAHANSKDGSRSTPDASHGSRSTPDASHEIKTQILQFYHTSIGSDKPIGSTFESESTPFASHAPSTSRTDCNSCCRPVQQPILYESRVMCLNCFRIHMGWMPKRNVKAAVEDDFIQHVRCKTGRFTWNTFLMETCVFQRKHVDEEIVMQAIRQGTWWTLYEAFTLMQYMLDKRIGTVGKGDTCVFSDENNNNNVSNEYVLDDKWAQMLLSRVMMEREGSMRGLVPSRYRFHVTQFDSRDGSLVWNILLARQQRNQQWSPLEYGLVLSGVYGDNVVQE
jgi:hypothetical protein